MGKPLVSILIPTYNRAEIVMGAARSAWFQTYPNLDIVVYDDGSEDRTPHLLPFLAREWEFRYVRCSQNRGIAHARNQLLQLAHGEYACWLDSDDLMNRWRVEIQLEVLRKTKASYVRTAFTSRFANQEAWEETPKYIERRQFGCATAMFRTEEGRAVTYDEKLVGGEDCVWEKALTLATERVGAYLPLAVYHVGRSSRFHRIQKHYRVKGKQEAWEKSMRRRDSELRRLIDELGAKGIFPNRGVPRVSEEECRGLLERCG